MQMKLGWGAGVAIAILLSLAALLFGLLQPVYALSLALLLAGIWTIISAFAVVEKKDRNYYAIWGVGVAVLSLFPFIGVPYTLGVLLTAVVMLILVNAYSGKPGKMLNTSAAQTSAAS